MPAHQADGRVIRVDARPEPIAIELSRSALIVVDMQKFNVEHFFGWVTTSEALARATPAGPGSGAMTVTAAPHQSTT
jgi:hypothetical protein